MSNAVMFPPVQDGARVMGVSFQGQAGQTDGGRRADGGNAVQLPDALAARQALAKKQAHKIVGDAFAGEKKIDANVREIGDHAERLRRDNLEAGDGIAEKRALIEAAKEQHGIGKGSREEAEVELWRRGETKDASMTEEEQEAYRALKERGLSQSQQDYLEHVGSYREQMELAEKQMADNDSQIAADYAAERAIAIERLKSDPMGEAQDEADAILDQANEELISGLFAEAKAHIDEEREKTEEAAEEKAEEEAERKERIEAAKERKEEREARIDDIRESASVPDMTKVQEAQEQVRSRVDEVLDKLKLLSEDVKGIQVDNLL